MSSIFRASDHLCAILMPRKLCDRKPVVCAIVSDSDTSSPRIERNNTRSSCVPNLLEISHRWTLSATKVDDDDRGNDGRRSGGPMDVAAAPSATRWSGCCEAWTWRRSRALGVAATLSGLRDTFLSAGEASLATWPVDAGELESHRLKARLGEMLLERELLEAKVAALEGRRPLDAEVAAMSRTAAPRNGEPYGVAWASRIGRATGDTVYRCCRSRPAEPPRPRDPAGPMPDAALVERIRAVLSASPSTAKGVAGCGLACASPVFGPPDIGCCGCCASMTCWRPGRSVRPADRVTTMAPSSPTASTRCRAPT